MTNRLYIWPSLSETCLRPEKRAFLWPSPAQSMRSEPFGVARAACFEELAGVFTSELHSESPYFRIERLSKFSRMTLGKIVSNNVLVTIPQREQD